MIVAAPRAKTPSLHQLQLFRRVVESASVARAAGELRLAPASVSMQVHDLERKLGATLLERSSRGVTPTAAGRMLYARAVAVSEQVEGIGRDLADLRALEAGSLRFASSRTIGSSLVPPLLRAFERDHPRVNVEFLLMPSSEQAKFAVLEGRAELALLGRVKSEGALDISPLCEEDMVVVIAPGHPLAMEARPEPRHLGRFTLLLRESGVLGGDAVRSALREAAVVPEIVELHSTEAIRSAAVEGQGVAVLPYSSVAADLRERRLVAVPISDFAPRRVVYVARECDAPLSPAARVFLALVREGLRPLLRYGG